MNYIIDRFEGDFAVLEDAKRKMTDIPRHLLPKNSKEGDVLTFTQGKYLVDAEETTRRKKENQKQLDCLWK